MPENNGSQRPLTRDQSRALHAYDCIDKIPTHQREGYETVVNDLGVNIKRSGLCAALAAVQRSEERGKLILEHLAGYLGTANLAGLGNANAINLVQQVRKLNADEYMSASREALLIAAWLKRATQATFGDR
jgi:CRISPR-associated protein Cmr5